MHQFDLVHPRVRELSAMECVLRERRLSLNQAELVEFKRAVLDFCYDDQACRRIGVVDAVNLPPEDMKTIYRYILDNQSDYGLRLYPRAA
jgi:hypothetical protein